MFTKRAYAEKFVQDNMSGTYWLKPRNGNYRATGRDIHNRPISRNYVVNDTKDSQSVWAMWHDFNGRWGLTSLWYISEDGSRILIWREY